MSTILCVTPQNGYSLQVQCHSLRSLSAGAIAVVWLTPLLQLIPGMPSLNASIYDQSAQKVMPQCTVLGLEGEAHKTCPVCT